MAGKSGSSLMRVMLSSAGGVNTHLKTWFLIGSLGNTSQHPRVFIGLREKQCVVK